MSSLRLPVLTSMLAVQTTSLCVDRLCSSVVLFGHPIYIQSRAIALIYGLFENVLLVSKALVRPPVRALVLLSGSTMISF